MQSFTEEIGNVFHNEIAWIIRRFDNVRDKMHILKWLDNFEEDERLFSLDLLNSYTYISEDDVKNRCSKLMLNVLTTSTICSHIYMVPIGSYVKSSSLLAYYLKKAESFKKLGIDGKITFLNEEIAFETTLFHNKNRFIFFDDFLEPDSP